MTEERARFRVRSAADLFDGLRSPDIPVKLGLLQALAARPEMADRYGPHQGRDVVDELIDQLAQTPVSGLRTEILKCLAAFSGRRVTAALAAELNPRARAEDILIAARRLGREEPALAHELLTPHLFNDDRPILARAAAEGLAGHDGLTSAERLRVALVGGTDSADPLPLTPQTEADWVEALSGPHRPRAWGLLARSGPPDRTTALGLWERLPEQRSELLAWAAEVEPEIFFGLAGRAFESGTAEDKLAALDLGGPALVLRPEMKPAVDALADSPDGRLRLAALRAGGEGFDLVRLALTGPEIEFRLAAIARLAALGTEAAADVLARLTDDADWRIRDQVGAAKKIM